MRTVILLAAAASVVAACSAPDSGVVRDRRFDPAWVEISNTCTWVYDSKGNASCRQTVVPVMHPDRWELKLDNGKDKGWRAVDHDAYSFCAIGERYPECAAPPGRSV